MLMNFLTRLDQRSFSATLRGVAWRSSGGKVRSSSLSRAAPLPSAFPVSHVMTYIFHTILVSLALVYHRFFSSYHWPNKIATEPSCTFAPGIKTWRYLKH